MIFKDNSYSYYYGWYFPLGIRIVVILIMTGALTASVNGQPMSLGSLPFLAFFIFVRKRLDINFTNKQYRETMTLFGMPVNRWKPIPPFEYVSVFTAKMVSTVNTRVHSGNFTGEEVQVNLVYPKNKKITAASIDSKMKAFDLATYFSVRLDNLRVLDATQRPFVWLDEQ
ncbi:MAG TPA: hypothetical protein VEC12_03260 [Bacteroidia bacterium]|nr:hypothetical protein [Bacteroidia bacterium]